MDRKQILELAVEALEKQKAGIDAEIISIRAELKGTRSRILTKVESPAAAAGKRRPRTPAERKAQSRRMRKHWAAKRAREEKAPVVKSPSPAAAERKTKAAAEIKASKPKSQAVKGAVEAAGKIARTKAKKAPKQPPKA
jgi:hypothetical protein